MRGAGKPGPQIGRSLLACNLETERNLFSGKSNVALRVDQPPEGGSTPTLPLQLNKRDWTVANCSQEVATALIEQWHYAKGVAKQAVAVHALYPASWHWYHAAEGVAWWMPPTKAAAQFFAGDKWEGVLACSRLVVVPDVPKNAASFLLSHSGRQIDRRWHTLISYADAWRGHTGAIYRAAGWQYAGQTRPTEVWTLNGRMVAMKAGPKTRTVSEMKALGATFQGRFPKSRWVLRRNF